MTQNELRHNFKRTDTTTLRELLNKRKLEGGWNEAILAEIEAEIEYRSSHKSGLVE